MQDNKMKKDIQIPVNPLGRLLLGICSRGTRDEGEKKISVLSIQSQYYKIAYQGKEKCEDYQYAKSMNSDAQGSLIPA